MSEARVARCGSEIDYAYHKQSHYNKSFHRGKWASPQGGRVRDRVPLDTPLWVSREMVFVFSVKRNATRV